MAHYLRPLTGGSRALIEHCYSPVRSASVGERRAARVDRSDEHRVDTARSREHPLAGRPPDPWDQDAPVRAYDGALPVGRAVHAPTRCCRVPRPHDLDTPCRVVQRRDQRSRRRYLRGPGHDQRPVGAVHAGRRHVRADRLLPESALCPRWPTANASTPATAHPVRDRAGSNVAARARLGMDPGRAGPGTARGLLPRPAPVCRQCLPRAPRALDSPARHQRGRTRQPRRKRRLATRLTSASSPPRRISSN
jgi:hypothetical protein